MKTTIITLVVLVVVGIGGYYLFFNNSSGGIPNYTPAASAVDTSAPASNTLLPSGVTVNIANFAFNPSTLTIKKGTKVTWTNNDSVSHTVTSDSGNLLNSPILAPGQTYSATFTSVGTTAYHCAIHTGMRGSITVTN